MDKYEIKLYAREYRDLYGIYDYIVHNLLEPTTASNMIDALEEAIYSLEYLPERGAPRRIGAYANGDYRQLIIAEKLNEAQNIAALNVGNRKDGYIKNDDYSISWCIGHLVVLYY